MCGNIPLVMRSTGKVPFLCSRSMEKRTRCVINVCVFLLFCVELLSLIKYFGVTDLLPEPVFAGQAVFGP